MLSKLIASLFQGNSIVWFSSSPPRVNFKYDLALPSSVFLMCSIFKFLNSNILTGFPVILFFAYFKKFVTETPGISSGN